MSNELVPYTVLSSKFLGRSESGSYAYEITLNQSLVHLGRLKGMEDGLNRYRESEILEHEENILKEAEEIKNRTEKQKKS